MTYRLITQSLKGTIEVSNEDFTYNTINYHGANFKIDIAPDAEC